MTTPLTPTSSSYVNTTQNLFVGATDTTKTATATLTVQTAAAFGPCTPGTQLVQWTMPTGAGTGTPPLFDTGTKHAQVSSALAAFSGASQSIDTAVAGSSSGVNSWAGVGPWDTATAPDPTFTATGANHYFEFTLDTSQFSGGTGVSISFQVNPNGGGWGGNNNNATYVYSSANGGPFSTIFQGLTNKNAWSQIPVTLAATTGTATTTFRINGGGAVSTAAPILIDNIVFTGCAATVPAPAPTLAKAFAPAQIPLNGTSVLTFTLANTSVGAVPLTGVKFTDVLPTGVQVAATPAFSTTCAGGPTWAPAAGATTLTFGNPTGASMIAGNSCTAQVTVTGTTTGPHANTSGYIFSTQSGSNTTGTGYGTANLDVLSPPVLAKDFGDTTILTGGTTLLTFTITNPNALNALTGVAFTDVLPLGLTVPTVGAAAQCGGLLSTTAPRTITFSGGSLAANASCSFSVTVTGATGAVAPGVTYTNTTAAVTSTNGGTGNTATAQLVVRTPVKSLKILKQVGLTNTGPWSSNQIVTAYPVFFQFTLENTGDTALTGGFTLNDTVTPGVNPAVTIPVGGCTPTLQTAGLAVFGTTVCTSNAFTPGVTTDTKTNTAFFTSAADGVTSNSSAVTFGTVNFGHLPTGGTCPDCFPATTTNLNAGTGARHGTGDTFLGASVPSEADGIDGAYSPQATDNGVVATPAAAWTTGSTGSVNITATCVPVAPATQCFLNAWIDWGKDGSMLESGDQIFTNLVLASGTFTVTRTFPIPLTAVLSGNAYGRFRLYKAQPVGASPTGFGSVGEVEDYVFNLDALNTAPVTLAYFVARRHEHGYRIEFSTSSEAANVGFSIYTPSASGVLRKDQLVKITPEPIRSTAKDPVSPQDYTFETTVDNPTGVFFLGDLDVYGTVRMHGPFSLNRAYGRKPRPTKPDWAGIRREHAKHQKEQDGEALAVMARGGSTAVRANLIVKTDGVHSVSYETLLAARFDFGGISINNLSLTNRGAAVPIEVTGAGKTFGPGSAVQFYGVALNTLYTYDNVYTLSVDKSGLRIANDGTAPSAGTPVASYLDTVKINKSVSYDIGATSGDPWYDTTLFTYASPISANFPITLDDVASTSGASLSTDFYGVTDFPIAPDHHVLVQMNGSTVSDQLFDGIENKNIKASLGSGAIHEGVNTLSLVLPGDTGADYDMVNVDRYSVTYPRQFRARSGRLTFTAAGSVFLVDGLPTSNVAVYRLAGTTPTRLTGATVETSGIGYAVRFPGATQAATYVVTALESATTPALSVPRAPTGVTDGTAQLLVISHPDFINNLGPLVAARQAEGLSVKIVNVNDVYAQYTFGNFDPAAIKSYVTYAAASMGTKYVLLVGGDTYDYRNDLGIGAVGFIPTLYKPTDGWVAYAPVDPAFGDTNNDGVPDVAVGRLPVRTPDELDSVIRKTLAYANKSYGETALFAADEDEEGMSFKAANAAFITTLPAGWSTQQANVGDLGVDAAHTSLIDRMNSGAALVSFYGHSSTDIWTFSGLFDSSDAIALTNVGSPLFVNQFGCWNNYYVSPYYETLAHAFLLAGDQGAAAITGAVALTETGSDSLLGKFLIPRMTTPGTRIGTAMIGAKKDAAAANANATNLADVLLGFVLMGDPTLKIQP
ncbi:MAG: C25 family cysteine peptidase [Thermoanaerobaculia bacterium]